MLMRVVDRFFRDRRSGHIVIAQWPNWPLWIFAVAPVVELIAGSTGPLGFAAHIVGIVALAIWAGDEKARGVNLCRAASEPWC